MLSARRERIAGRMFETDITAVAKAVLDAYDAGDFGAARACYVGALTDAADRRRHRCSPTVGTTTPPLPPPSVCRRGLPAGRAAVGAVQVCAPRLHTGHPALTACAPSTGSRCLGARGGDLPSTIGPIGPIGTIEVEADVIFMTAFGRTLRWTSTPIPASRTLPLALIIHGGGFVGGDKADRAREAIKFAERGFRAVSINCKPPPPPPPPLLPLGASWPWGRERSSCGACGPTDPPSRLSSVDPRRRDPLCRDMFDHTTGALHPWDADQPRRRRATHAVRASVSGDRQPSRGRPLDAGQRRASRAAHSPP